MHEFTIHFGSVRDVEDFVSMSTVKPFPIHLDDGQHRVNGKNFMELFCLVMSRPLRVTAECSDEEFEEFCREAARFLCN